MSSYGLALRGLRARRDVRLALGILGTLVAMALLADCLASDLPIAARFGGELHVLPNVFRPAALAPYDLERLAAEAGPDDFILPPLVPFGPNQQDKGRPALEPPSARHWLGTDEARRDVLARLVHGARTALGVGLVAVGLYVLLGTLLGLLAGYLGGWVDVVISRLTEAVLAVPVFFLILAVVAVVEGAGLTTVMLSMALVLWTRTARLVRAEALRLKQREFVQAARLLGFSSWRIMWVHVLPNALGPVLVTAAFGLAGAVSIEASLSFLGFGAPESTASWGGLLHGALGNWRAWWLVVIPGLFIFATVLAYNLLGEALRDLLDPRTSREPGA